ncbi:SEC-C metal-binding domain-containing protein [Candidatus Nitrososphaera gargensis]|uniref:SEC-C metal-binding domain-containing protein n=1 Tax=Candidatus Nitrososphaera gargensis TaxID=497727 RepID=UPI0038993E86
MFNPGPGNFYRKNTPSPKSKGHNSGKTKVGRNDPCPCGSGRKFKKCCLKMV